MSRDEVQKELVSKLNSNSTWNTMFRSGTGMQIISLFGQTYEMIVKAVGSALYERNLLTSQLESSTRQSVHTLGVRANRKIPASCSVMLRNYGGTPITIPRFTTLAHGGKTLYNRVPYSINANEEKIIELFSGDVSTIVVPNQIATNGLRKQGSNIIYISEESDFSWSDGESYYEGNSYRDTSVIIDNVYVNVVTEGIWLHPSKVSPAIQDKTLPDGRTMLVFGDNTYGVDLSNATSISIIRVSTNGADDNTFMPKTETTFYGMEAVVLTDLENGANQTDYRNYKVLGPNLATIRNPFNKAVTQLQHEAIALNYPGVVDARVLSQRHIAPADRRYMNVQAVCILTDNGPPSENFWNNFLNYYRSHTYENAEIQRLVPSVIKAQFSLILTCEPSVDLTYAKESSYQALVKYFSKTQGSLNKNYFLNDVADVARYSSKGIVSVYVNDPSTDIILSPDTPAVDYILTAGNKNGVRSYRVIAECSVGGKVIYSKPSDKIIVNLINQTVNLKITPVAGAVRYHIFNEDSNLIATLNKDVKTWTDNTTGEVYPISNIESYKYNVNQYYVEPSLIDIITKYEE